MFKTLRAKGLAGTLDMGRFLLASPRDWLSETFESEQVRALLAAWGMHLDFAPDVGGGALFPYLEGMANQSFGMVLGKGGADTVTRALVRAIEARGGTVTCSAPVARIMHAGGRATGIVLADGREVTARRAVIGGVAPRALARLTGGTGDRRFDSGLARFSHAPGTMMIHLAMESLPDWAAGEELKRFAYVHLAPSMDQMARTYAQAQAGLLPDAPVVVVGQPTAVDPSRAPEGRHVLWLQVRMAPGTIQGDAAGEITATAWDQAAGPFAARAWPCWSARLRARAARSSASAPSPRPSSRPTTRTSWAATGLRFAPSVATLPLPAAARACGRLDPDQGASPDRGRRVARGGNRRRIGLSSGQKAGRRVNKTDNRISTMTLNRRSLLKLSAASMALGLAGLPSFAAIDELVIAYNVTLPSWDPTVGPSAVNPTIQGIYQSVFDQFIYQNPDLTPAPGLLTEWGWNEDRTKVIMKVREGVTWHDGSPFTAEDVAWSLNRAAQESTGNPIQFIWSTLGNFQVDGNTVTADVVRFEPTIFKWMYFLTGYVLPKAYYEKVGAEGFEAKPIGTGPYMVDSFERNAFVRLKANPNYWGGKPEFETVTIKFVPDAASRVAEIESGNSHVTLEMPYEEFDRLKAGGMTGYATPISDIGMIFLNDIDVMNDPNVRKAAAHAIDKQTIIDRLLSGYGVAIDTLETPEYEAYDPRSRCPTTPSSRCSCWLPRAMAPTIR